MLNVIGLIGVLMLIELYKIRPLLKDTNDKLDLLALMTGNRNQ